MEEGVGITYDVSVSAEELEGVVTKVILSNERFKPYRVVIDSDHALAIEFGSRPIAPDYQPGSKKGQNKNKNMSGGDTLYEKIKEWYKARNRGIYTESSVYLIYRSIMRNGTPPQPFIRPAIHAIESKIANGAYGENVDTKKIADELVENMKENLRKNFTIYPGGSIEKSIRIEEYVGESGLDKETEFLRGDLWKSDTANYEGDSQPAINREINRHRLKWRP